MGKKPKVSATTVCSILDFTPQTLTNLLIERYVKARGFTYRLLTGGSYLLRDFKQEFTLSIVQSAKQLRLYYTLV